MRKKRYKGKEGFIYGESGNLPEWCSGNARELWYQSDRFERANGVTSRKIEFSLQTEIKDIELQKKLIRDVIRVASHGDGLPYSFAVHNSADGHNPHVHIMISSVFQMTCIERLNTISRDTTAGTPKREAVEKARS